VTSLDDEPADGVAEGKESTGRVPKHTRHCGRAWSVERELGSAPGPRSRATGVKEQQSREVCARGAIRESCGRDPTVWHWRVCPSGEAWSKIDDTLHNTDHSVRHQPLCTAPGVSHDDCVLDSEKWASITKAAEHGSVALFTCRRKRRNWGKN